MWTKTIKTKVKGEEVIVQIWLYDTDTDLEVVRIQSVVNELYLIEDVKFENRESAYSFIKHYPVSLANDFVLRVGYSAGVFDN